MKRLSVLLVAGLAGVATGACTSESGPNISGLPAYQILEVRVSPRADTVLIADTVRATDRVQFVATAYGRAGLPLTADIRFVWQTTDSTVATVDSGGLVTPRRPGVVGVSASASKVGHARLVILAASKSVVVSPPVDTVLPGERSRPSVASAHTKGLAPSSERGTTIIVVASRERRARRTLQVVPLLSSVRAAAAEATALAGDPVVLSEG